MIALVTIYLMEKNLPEADKWLKKLINLSPYDQKVFQLRFEYKKLEATK